jgi:hypothetical protein
VATSTADVAVAQKWWSLNRDAYPAGETGILPGKDRFAYAEPAALRSLLQRLGVKVVCTFADTGSNKKDTPGKGMGPRYRLHKAVMTCRDNGSDLCASDGSLYGYTQGSSNTTLSQRLP